MVVVFTEEERRGWVNPYLTAALMRMALDHRIRLTYIPMHAIHPVDAARNRAVDEFFLPSDADVLVMFDNDVGIPQNIVDIILSTPEECDIAVLPYWVWLKNEMHCMPCFGHWEDGLMVTPDPATLTEGWQEMGAGGTGCMWARRRVFTSDKLQSPFFKIISDSHKGQLMSEDVYFTGRAHEAGFKVFENADHICSHFRTVDLAEVNIGTVRILHRFMNHLKQKYGEVKGVEIGSIIQELHPELSEAAELLRQQNSEAK